VLLDQQRAGEPDRAWVVDPDDVGATISRLTRSSGLVERSLDKSAAGKP
jgi:hypothetical protein